MLLRPMHLASLCDMALTDAIVCGGTSEEVAAMDDVWRLDIVSGKPPAVIVGTSCQIHGKWRKLPVSLKEPIFFHTAVLSEV